MASLDYTFRRLVNILGPERVSRDPMERLIYSHDFASLPKLALLQWKMIPDFVVVPKTVEEVSRLVTFSYEAGLPLVPRGGGTGLVGGAVPNRGGILVDLRRMDRVETVDVDRRIVTVQAGRAWKELADIVASRGMFLPVLPLGAPASTVGGWFANGGVGIGSYKYGDARDFVVDMEVVLPSGEIVRTADRAADLSTAYANLNPAFFGSEGTIGIITSATLQLLPKPEALTPLSYSFKDLWAARDIPAAIAGSDLEPYHAAVMDPVHLALVKAVRPDSIDPQALVNVAFDGPKDEVTASEKEMDALIAGLGGKKLAEAVARSQWEGRFDLYPARRITGGLVVTQAEFPISRFPDMLKRTTRLTHKLRMQVAVNSFLLDPNSLSVEPYFPMEEQAPTGPLTLAFVKKFADVALALGGHPRGLGLFTAFNFPKVHKAAAGIYESIKAQLDPYRKMNPGKLTEVWTRYDLPIVDKIPPEIMGFGLDVAAVVRRLKPTSDRYVTVETEAR